MEIKGTIEIIQDLVVENKIEEGLSVLLDFLSDDEYTQKEILIIKARYNHLQKDIRAGTMPDNTIIIEYNTIRRAILDITIAYERKLKMRKNNEEKAMNVEGKRDELITLFEFRYNKMIIEITKNFKYIDINFYTKLFENLHANHIKALKNENIIVAFEIMKEIYQLLNKMENEENKITISKKIKKKKFDKKTEKEVLDIIDNEDKFRKISGKFFAFSEPKIENMYSGVTPKPENAYDFYYLVIKKQ